MIKYSREWVEVARIETQYTAYTLTEFLEMVKKVVPEGTKSEDISLEFESNISSVPYYDDYYADGTLTISVRKTNEQA